jgi:hypothetical protein
LVNDKVWYNCTSCLFHPNRKFNAVRNLESCSNCYANSNTNPNTCRYANAYANSNTNSNTCRYANTYANSNTCRYANTYANRNNNRNAKANTIAFINKCSTNNSNGQGWNYLHGIRLILLE